jgi:hypothetical protein
MQFLLKRTPEMQKQKQALGSKDFKNFDVDHKKKIKKKTNR